MAGEAWDRRLTDLERDALAELGNMGIGRASTALGRMVGELVRLSVPSVEVMDPDAAIRSLGEALPGPLIGVSESLGGVFDGTALFLFPETDSLPLVRAALPPDVPPEEAGPMEEEALAELGNIVLNSALALVANLLGGGIDTSLPAVRRGTAAAILADCRKAGFPGGGQAGGAAGAEADDTVVLFRIDLRATAQTLGGRVVLMLDPGSMGRLRGTLGRFIGRVSGG
ncbi:chemotaxis protein CheC [Azospirillum agricola]|uniref:chemotaxis protein CheC n=1 Tax=Azospirillum agricola TaxID=1720247 RepID=UPI001F29ACCD|nr:chemotaxis protein CheC [Azospirillum agricola]MBP2228541.1 chemotaxis protein CheC [Azospirillum agricola]